MARQQAVEISTPKTQLVTLQGHFKHERLDEASIRANIMRQVQNLLDAQQTRHKEAISTQARQLLLVVGLSHSTAAWVQRMEQAIPGM